MRSAPVRAARRGSTVGAMEIEDETGGRARRVPPWRRDLDVLDAYDVDRVCSEGLADDLVNELLRGPGRGERSRRTTRRRYSFTAASTT